MGSGNLPPKKLLFTRKSNQPKLFPDRLPPSEVQQHSEHDPLDVMRLHLKRTPRRKGGGFTGATTSDEPSQVRRYGKSKQRRTKKKKLRQALSTTCPPTPYCSSSMQSTVSTKDQKASFYTPPSVPRLVPCMVRHIFLDRVKVCVVPVYLGSIK